MGFAWPRIQGETLFPPLHALTSLPFYERWTEVAQDPKPRGEGGVPGQGSRTWQL